MTVLLVKENLQIILSTDKQSNIFLYVDPYGIKSLSLNHFKQIQERKFSSLEVLMNFNSAGFLREGCRILNYEVEETLKDDDFADYESDDDDSIERMNSIAGGIYWQDIINDYYKKKIAFYQAEEMFISEYSKKIKEIYKYTVNIPIRIKSNHLPKYRLIFGGFKSRRWVNSYGR